MKIPVRPELPTAALRSSQATHAAVDNSAPSAICRESTYKSGKIVQTNGATSFPHIAAAGNSYTCLYYRNRLMSHLDNRLAP
jgi:hypothetical protein